MTDDRSNEAIPDDVMRAWRLRQIDLDHFEGLDNEQIRTALTRLANEAGPVILRAFMDGSVGTSGDDDLPSLIERYVERRMRTIADLIRLKKSFSFEGE